MERYVLLFDNDWCTYASLPDALRLSRRHDEYLWSARLATGLFGEITCPSGRRGPSGRNEVLFALGVGGLHHLVELGFIPCSSCHSEKREGFWPVIKSVVQNTYAIDNLDDFVNKEILPFDARRLEWETLIPIVGAAPNRLYVPQGLSPHEVIAVQERFDRLNIPMPLVGWYDRDASDKFCEYQLPAGR